MSLLATQFNLLKGNAGFAEVQIKE